MLKPCYRCSNDWGEHEHPVISVSDAPAMPEIVYFGDGKYGLGDGTCLNMVTISCRNCGFAVSCISQDASEARRFAHKWWDEAQKEARDD